jgi:predicted nucleic-acid-binding protein
MKAIDTNIVVRFLTQDDEVQFTRAVKLFTEEQLFIPETVFLETEWVLRFSYCYTSSEIIEGFRNILGLPNVHVEDLDKIIQIIEWYQQGIDFADAVHLANSQPKSSELLTFDRRFINRAKHLSRCLVREP